VSKLALEQEEPLDSPPLGHSGGPVPLLPSSCLLLVDPEDFEGERSYMSPWLVFWSLLSLEFLLSFSVVDHATRASQRGSLKPFLC